MKTFEEFWPHYVREHGRLATRVLHFIGTTGAMIGLANGVATGKSVFFILTPVFGYGFAWFSHYKLEKNRPTTFRHPWWSLRADLRMWAFIITGHMRTEIERCKIKN